MSRPSITKITVHCEDGEIVKTYNVKNGRLAEKRERQPCRNVNLLIQRGIARRSFQQNSPQCSPEGCNENECNSGSFMPSQISDGEPEWSGSLWPSLGSWETPTFDQFCN